MVSVIYYYIGTHLSLYQSTTMKKLIISTFCFLLLAIAAFAQVHRDTDGNASTGLDFVSIGIGVVIGVIIGYLIGSRTRKA